MPDFDVDFCMEGRDRVIEYVAETYGRDRVSQIITYGTMAAKAVVRDVGRVLGHPYGFVDRIAKLIPFELGITLDKALAQEDALRELYEQDEEVAAVIDLGRKLEGITRNAGKHAGGVVISPSRLTDFTPLYCEPGGQGLVTQFDKDDVEAVGLVKFDFLGLRTLTIIDWALQTINRRRQENGEEPIDIASIPLDDGETFDLLKRCATTAVFQLESRGMKDLIKRLQPDTFEDIIALVALFRPGPLQSGMVDDFINRKHGRAKVEYPHPDLESILKPTYGIILYQEQVMQIAQVLAGYSLGAADLLRRAMGKKKPEEMAKQRAVFTEGALKRGVDEKTATHIFDLMEKFAGYGFNKSHSAAYALVSYHRRVPRHGAGGDPAGHQPLPLPLHHHRRADHPLRAGGHQGGEAMIEAREKGGPFSDLFDFCQRIDLKKANRRVLETLIRSGAMDRLGPNRATLMDALPEALRIAEQRLRDAAMGQTDLFGLGGDAAGTGQYRPRREWDEEERLRGEKDDHRCRPDRGDEHAQQ